MWPGTSCPPSPTPSSRWFTCTVYAYVTPGDSWSIKTMASWYCTCAQSIGNEKGVFHQHFSQYSGRYGPNLTGLQPSITWSVLWKQDSSTSIRGVRIEMLHSLKLNFTGANKTGTLRHVVVMVVFLCCLTDVIVVSPTAGLRCPRPALRPILLQG